MPDDKGLREEIGRAIHVHPGCDPSFVPGHYLRIADALLPAGGTGRAAGAAGHGAGRAEGAAVNEWLSCRHPFGCQAPGEGCEGPCPVTEAEADEIERRFQATPAPPVTDTEAGRDA